MKTRIISAVVGVSILLVILFLYETLILNLAIAIFSIMGIYELYKITGLLKKCRLSFYIAATFGAVLPFLFYFNSFSVLCLAVFLFFVLTFLLELLCFLKVSIFNYAFTILSCLIITCGFGVIIYLRDNYILYGLYYILLVFASSWICDAGAYFIGSFFGKTKLAKRISPNKTIEGAIGGIALNVIFILLLSLFVSNCLISGLKINYISLLIYGILSSFIGILGDLCSSVVKRELNVKDYGNLIPGHGGVIDRFDSFLFVSIFFFVYINLSNIAYI